MRFKKILKVILFLNLFVALDCFAFTPGPYMGALTGAAYMNITAQNQGIGTAQNSNTGFAYGIFVGYQFNTYCALEWGFTYYPITRLNNINDTNINGYVREMAADLVVKATYPFSDTGFSLSGKGGLAVYNVHPNSNVTGPDVAAGTVGLPTYGLGVGYDITKVIPIEFAWSRIQSTSAHSDYQSVDFFYVSIAYYFGT